MSREFRWSWSGLGDYSQCPRKYFLGRIAKIEVETAPQLLAGVKFHDFAEKFNQSLINNKDKVNEEFIKDWYDKAETDEERNFILFEIERYNNLKEDGNEKYYIPVACESWLENDFDGEPFRGKQDYLGLTPDGDYFIMDYKTRFPGYPRDALTKLQHQLILYAELAGKQFDIDIKMIAGYFYKEKNDNPSKKTFFKKYHQATKTALKKYVKKTINGILTDEKFEPKIGNLCGYCSFKDICWGLCKNPEIQRNELENKLEHYINNKQEYYKGYDLNE